MKVNEWAYRLGCGLVLIMLLSLAVLVASTAILQARKALLAFGLAMVVGCGFNPVEGDWGPVEVVPERDTCWVKVRHPGGRVNYEPRWCDGDGHDLKVFGARW